MQSSVRRDHLQTYNRDYEGGNEENTPECHRLVEKKDPQEHRPHSPYPGPYGVSRPYRQRLYSLGQKEHAEHQAEQEACTPKKILRSAHLFHFSETEGEAGLEAAGDYKHQPVHDYIVFFKGAKIAMFTITKVYK